MKCRCRVEFSIFEILTAGSTLYTFERTCAQSVMQPRLPLKLRLHSAPLTHQYNRQLLRNAKSDQSTVMKDPDISNFLLLAIQLSFAVLSGVERQTCFARFDARSSRAHKLAFEVEIFFFQGPALLAHPGPRSAAVVCASRVGICTGKNRLIGQVKRI